MATGQRGTTGPTMKRRGLIAGAAALVAGVFAKQAAQTVTAAAYNFQGDSTTNAGTVPTSLTATAGFSGGTLFTLDASAATGNVEGVRVLGGNNRSAIISIAKGATLPTSFYCAIYGTGMGTGTTPGTGASGVLGDSTNFVGVRGFSNNYYGVHGTGAIGVYGNNTTNGTAVRGDGTAGTGVVGTSTSGLGASFQGGLGPLRLVPGTASARTLAAAGHQVGELYVTSDARVFFFDGANWREVLLAAPGGGVSPAAAARASTAGNVPGTAQPMPVPRQG